MVVGTAAAATDQDSPPTGKGQTGGGALLLLFWGEMGGKTKKVGTGHWWTLLEGPCNARYGIAGPVPV